MKPEIPQQLARLGGNVDGVKGRSLREDLQAIVFTHPLYPKSNADEFYGIDEFYHSHQALYLSNKEAFYQALLAHFFSDHTRAYGQDFFRNFLFTPFTENTADYGELDGLVTPEEIKQVIPDEPLEFLCICYSYGFPDRYFVNLADKDQENPTVYGTDHEVYFQEIDSYGTLDTFFERYLSKAEFLAHVQDYLENRTTTK